MPNVRIERQNGLAALHEGAPSASPACQCTPAHAPRLVQLSDPTEESEALLIGKYTIKFCSTSSCSQADSCINATTNQRMASCTRTVHVRDTKAPNVTLFGERTISGFEAGADATFEDPGVRPAAPQPDGFPLLVTKTTAADRRQKVKIS